MTKKRQRAIDRMAEAITFYREHEPTGFEQQVKLIQSLAYRYGFSLKTMTAAIHMMAGGINAELKEI